MAEPAPPRRLRDLRGDERALVAVAFGLLVVPFVVSVWRAYADGWVPTGDDANIAIRALDVFSRHPPLTGLPTTSYQYGARVFTYHPGPIEFYILAVPIRVLGGTAGSLLTAAAINLATVFIALWVCFRRAGTVLMLWAACALLAVMVSSGSALLSDPLSSSMTLYPLLCSAVLAWAVADGDLRLLPLAALVMTYAAQQHLAAALMIAALAVCAGVVLGVRAARRDREMFAGTRRFVIGAVVIAAVCWTPVVIDQARGRPGNLTAIWQFARDNTRPTLGLRSGLSQAVHAIVPPTILAKSSITGKQIYRDATTIALFAGGLVVAALFVTAIAARRARPALSRLAVFAIVVVAAGTVNGANVPASIEATKVNLYRWTWTAAFLTWVTLGWAAAEVVAHLRSSTERTRKPQFARVGLVALLVFAVAIAATNIVVDNGDSHSSNRAAFASEPRLASVVLSRVDRSHPVVVLAEGSAGPGGSASQTIASYVIYQLVRRGITVQGAPFTALFLGSHRAYHGEPNATGVLVRTSNGPFPPSPGTVLRTEVFDPEYSALLDRLEREARGAPVVLTPEAQARVHRDYPGTHALFIVLAFQRLRTDPREALADPLFLDFVSKGYLSSPAFDRAAAHRAFVLSSHRHALLGTERVDVSLLNPEQLRASGLARQPIAQTPVPTNE